MASTYETELKIQALQLAGGNIDQAKQIYEWLKLEEHRPAPGSTGDFTQRGNLQSGGQFANAANGQLQFGGVGSNETAAVERLAALPRSAASVNDGTEAASTAQDQTFNPKDPLISDSGDGLHHEAEAEGQDDTLALDQRQPDTEPLASGLRNAAHEVQDIPAAPASPEAEPRTSGLASFLGFGKKAMAGADQ